MNSRGIAFAVAVLFSAPVGAADAIPVGITATETGVGTIFETATGYALYTYDKDGQTDRSACVAECVLAWPPLLADDSATPVGKWRIIQRPEGARQWSFDGRPVYRYAKDSAPGLSLGGGVQDVWHVLVDLAPRPQVVRYQGTDLGRVAATAAGLTLYVSSRPCLESCLSHRQPMGAAWTANPIGDWSVRVREDDATKQWAYRGDPVYTFSGDLLPGDLNGQGEGWTAIVLQPAPAPPPWVKVQISDHGPIFADARGMTLYAINTDMDELKRLFCGAACMSANWAPMLADASARSGGHWTIAAGAAGPQWHYRGEPVFTFKGDRAPGDITGDRFAVGNGFGGFHVLWQRSAIEETL